MDLFTNARVLIIDDDQQLCRMLEELLGSWGMRPESLSQPLSAMERIRGDSFSLFLVDVCMPETSGLDLVPLIAEQCPDAKTIMMTGFADKETAIRALKLGAFDLLEKPFRAEFLSHALHRALEAQAAERRSKQLMEDLQRSHAELLSRKEQLEFLNKQLMETNRALSILAQNIEHERDETEKKIALKLRSLVIPAIGKLRQDKNLARYGTELDLLVQQIKDLTAGFSLDARIASTLSFTELRIASLIKNGLTSEEIADQMSISVATVRTHRKNIRKKLKINNAQYSLRNYLSATNRSV